VRWIYLSPHFDDAVLSCGGLMWEQRRRGEEVAIWTIFAAPPLAPLSPLAQATHALWGFGPAENAPAIRRAEDDRAARRLRVHVRRFPFLDCIYRRSPDGDPLYPHSVFVPPHPQDADLPRRIAARLSRFLLPQDCLVSPLGLGGHVDHLLTRRAAESLSWARRYYADFPYVMYDSPALLAAIADLTSEYFPISEHGLRVWWRGVAAYASQLTSLWKGEGTLQQALHSYWARERGILLWREAV
jgi:LmbE family N-acetylglucosaminyl deacetylase